MPRIRLRPDYVRRNYTYDATLRGPMPQTVWDMARGMQSLWNGLTDRLVAVREQYDASTPRADVKALYDQFWAASYLYVREEGTRLGLSAWPKWGVYETFQVAQRRFAKRQGGVPHAHHGLRKIMIPYRMQPGGQPVSWLYQDGPRQPVGIKPPQPGHHHQDVWFSVQDERVLLRLVLHRPLPPEAIVKRVSLLGTFEPTLRRPGETGWHWRIQFAVELPPPVPEPKAQRVCGLDLGWRVLEHGLRLAVLTDGQTTWEWILPYDLSNWKIRKRRKFHAAHGETLYATGNWRYHWTQQSELDAQLEVCKAALREWDTDSWPEIARDSMTALTKMRASGLRRVHRYLQEANIPCPPLATWEILYIEHARRIRAAQLRALRHKQYLYRLLADWLARHYDIVSWEGDLDLKELAEAPVEATEYALRESAKYRQMAGLSLLRTYIRERMARAGKVILDQKSAYTTQTCAQCGSPIPSSAALLGTCLEGHVQDQDINAATILYDLIPEGEREAPRLAPPSVDREQLLRSLVRLV